MFPPETRFLIVDDAVSMRTVLKRFLKDMGYSHFLEAPDGQAAFELLEAGHEIDVIFSDHMMPRCSGLELLGKLGEIPKYARIPLIMVTADWEKTVVLRALQLGAIGFVEKPVLPEQLQAQLSSSYKRIPALRSSVK